MNKLKCKICGDVICSITVHDFQQCSCKSCYVDGGFEYFRVGFKNINDVEFVEE